MARGSQIRRQRAVRVDVEGSLPFLLFALTVDELLEMSVASLAQDATLEAVVDHTNPQTCSVLQEVTMTFQSEVGTSPIAVTVAISSRIRFVASRGPNISESIGTVGVLEFPVADFSERPPLILLAGHYELLAASRAELGASPVSICGIEIEDIRIIREQFRRLSGVPRLNEAIADELFPLPIGMFPQRLAAKDVPSAICQWLHESEHSPFRGLITGLPSVSGSRKKPVLPAASISMMIDESISTPSGCLFPYRNVATGETDFEGICRLLVAFWNGVRHAFPDAWGKPPARSRLMHGVGVRAMGRLMDLIMPAIDASSDVAVEQVAQELARIEPFCRWTTGTWDECGLKWDEIQNVPRHIHMISSILIRAYFHAVSPKK